MMSNERMKTLQSLLLLLVTLLGLCPLDSWAQQSMSDVQLPKSNVQHTMSDVLRQMPDSLVPYLTANNRLDMIDFREANMKAEVRNAMDGKSELAALTDRYALLQLNAAHRMELCLLPFDGGSQQFSASLDGGQLLCIVDTYGVDIRESTVRFFTPSWQPLNANRFLSLPADLCLGAQSSCPFVAELTQQDSAAELLLTPSDFSDRPALEDQREAEKVPIKLKWTNNIFK